MGTVLLLIKLFIPVVSAMGIAFYFSRNEKIGVRFAPLFSASAIVTVLFVSGILNILHIAVWFVMAFGLVRFAYHIFIYLKEKNYMFFIHPVWIYIAVMFMLLIVLFKDAYFVDSDEYSHWGTMLKEMISVNGFPDARTVIDYKEYPPACALFMYFITKLTGFSHSISYMAQGLFAVMALSCLFGEDGFKNPVEVIKSAVLSFVLLGMFTQTFHTLLVEYIIGIYAVALLVYITENEGWIGDDIAGRSKYLAPLMITLAIVKTNAMVFYGMALVVIAVILYRKRKADNCCPLCKLSKKEKIQTALFITSPLSMLFLWTAYIKKVYLGKGYATVKFALTKENLLKNYIEKPDWIIDKVYNSFFHSLYRKDRPIMVALTLAAAVILIVLLKKKYKINTNRLSAAAGISAAVWVIYCIGYVFTLLFLMPYWEMDEGARILISYDRYMSLPAAVIAAYIIYCRFSLLQDKRINKIMSVFVCCVLVGMNIPFLNQTIFIDRYDEYYKGEALAEFQQFASRVPRVYGREDGLLFYIGEKEDNSSVYNNHIFEKEFLNRNISNISNTKINAIPYQTGDGSVMKEINKARYLILADPNPGIIDIIENTGVSFQYSPECNIYFIVRDETDTPVHIIPAV